MVVVLDIFMSFLRALRALGPVPETTKPRSVSYNNTSDNIPTSKEPHSRISGPVLFTSHEFWWAPTFLRRNF